MDVISLFLGKNVEAYWAEESFTHWEFLVTQHWFFPCYCYECYVSVEKQYESALNLFEKTILQLLQNTPVKDLPSLLLWEEPLVEVILGGLQRKSLINGGNALTDSGRTLLEEEKSRPKQQKELLVKLFLNPYTQEIFPYLQWEVEKEEKEEEKEEHLFPFFQSGKTRGSFTYGSAGKQQTIHGAVLPDLRTERLPPSPSEFQEKLQVFLKKLPNLPEMKEFFQEYTLSPENAQSNQVVPNFYKPKQSLTYFHLQAGILKGNEGEIFVSDGITPHVTGILPIHGVGFTQGYAKKMEKLIQGLRDEVEEKTSPKKKKPQKIHPDYPQLPRDWVNPLRNSGESQDEFLEMMRDMKQKLHEMYRGLEWGLWYHRQKNPVAKEKIQDLFSHSGTENQSILEEILKKHQIPQGRYNLIEQCTGGQLQQYHQTPTEITPSMKFFLPLLILENRGESTPLFKECKEKIPFFYETLCELHQPRNKSSHGEQSYFTRGDFLRFQEMSISFLDVLLPSWREDLVVEKIPETSETAQMERVMNWQNIFGYVEYHQILTGELRELLLSYDPQHSPLDEIIRLSSLMEQTLIQYRQKHPPVLPPENRESRQFLLPSRDILEGQSLPFVKKEKIFATLSGRKQGLLSELWIFLYFGEEEKVNWFIKQEGIPLVKDLSELRGHGCVPVLLRKEELNTLQQQVIHMMKGMLADGEKE